MRKIFPNNEKVTMQKVTFDETKPMARYETKLEGRGAYIIDEKLLRDVHEVCGTFLGAELNVSIKLDHGSTIEGPSIGELLDDNILRAESIRELSVSGFNSKVDPPRRLRFNLQNETIVLPAATAEIKGERERCRSFRVQIDDLLTSARQWYWPFALDPNSFQGWVLLGAATVVVGIASAVWRTKLFAPTQSELMLGMIGDAVPALLLFYWANKLLFPRLVFDIGRSAATGRRASALRTIVFGGIILAGIVGTIASVIANHL